jgi:hypothetical protein
MAIAFTCGKCDSRTVKAFSRQAYEQGVVLITCPSCKAMHLIADHLGWFGDKGFKVGDRGFKVAGWLMSAAATIAAGHCDVILQSSCAFIHKGCTPAVRQ